MTSLLESPANAAKLRELTIKNKVADQLQHCFKVIVADRDFRDLGTIFNVNKVIVH